MSSSWKAEILAVFRKEVISEFRARSGILTAGLFSVLATVIMAFGSQSQRLTPSLAAGMFWVTLLFSAVVSLPRSFTAEEEQMTANLLRVYARPHAVFWGKALFNFLQMAITALVLSLLFLVLVGISVKEPVLFLSGVLLGCGSLAGAVTFCAALVAQAANRAVLAGVISLPLLVPLVVLGVVSTRAGLGEVSVTSAWNATLGIGLYGVAFFAAGPHLFAAVWKD